MSQATKVPAEAVIEADPDGQLIVTLEVGGTFYRIPLASQAPAFEPVNPDDVIRGPVEFTPEMEAAFTRMTECASYGPDIYAYLSFGEAVLLCFYRQVYNLEPDSVLRFADANQDAIASGGNYPATAAPVIPAAKYYWEEAAATAWRRIKRELGQ